MYSSASLPATLDAGDVVSVTGEVRYYSAGGFWELVIGAATTQVVLLQAN